MGVAFLSGCTVGPDYQPPKALAPAQWSAPQTVGDYATWWKSFEDPMLNALIEEALASNPDIKQAQARVLEVRQQRTLAIAAGLPSLTGRGNLSKRRNSSSQTGSTGGGFSTGQQILNIFQMGFDAQWELDFFGGIRRSLEAADALIELEEDNVRLTQITLLAEVSRNYIELRSNQNLLSLAEDTLKSQQDTLDLTRIRRQAGMASSLEEAQVEAQWASIQAQLPIHQNAIKQSIHALSLLLGKEPNALNERLGNKAFIPYINNPLLADVPSELLRRRPDIRRAERQLAAGNAQIGIAVAELYPKVNLAAFLGLQNPDITSFTPIGKSWSMASSLSLPIFNWGKLKANIKAKEALQEQFLYAYQNTVLTAFKEVEDALSAYSSEKQKLDALKQGVAASQLALDLANERYRKGLSAYFEVLIAERTLFQNQTEQTESEAQLSIDLIALYKALGGGWRDKVSNESVAFFRVSSNSHRF